MFGGPRHHEGRRPAVSRVLCPARGSRREWLRPFLLPRRCRRDRERPTRVRSARAGRREGCSRGRCVVLHAAGFTVPRVSPRGRCALTAPFHPDPRTEHTRAVCFLWHFPSALGLNAGWGLPTAVPCRARTFLRRARVSGATAAACQPVWMIRRVWLGAVCSVG